MKDKDIEESKFKYLSHVTLRQAWSVLKPSFFAWLMLTVLFLIIDIVTNYGENEVSEFWNILPKQAWFIIGFAFVSWVARGEEEVIKFRFPMKLKNWITLNLMVSLLIVLIPFLLLLPPWAYVSLFFGLLVLGVALDDLAKIGKQNIEDGLINSKSD